VSIILPGWNANRNVPIDENIIYDGNSFYLDIMLTFFISLKNTSRAFFSWKSVILCLVLRPVSLNCGRFDSHSTKHQADDFNIRGIGHDTSFFQRFGELFARTGMNVSINFLS
jgi:hypothetical protein